MSGDMHVNVSFGDLSVDLTAENTSWSGEVMRDLVNRALDGLERGLAITAAYDVIDADDDDGEP